MPRERNTMSAVVECPDCQLLNTFGPESAGRPVACRQCGATLRVPGRPAPRPRRRDDGQDVRRLFPFVAACVFMAFLLAGLAVGGLFLWDAVQDARDLDREDRRDEIRRKAREQREDNLRRRPERER